MAICNYYNSTPFDLINHSAWEHGLIIKSFQSINGSYFLLNITAYGTAIYISMRIYGYIYIYTFIYMHIFLNTPTSEMFYTDRLLPKVELKFELSSGVYSRCKVHLRLTIPVIYTVWWLRKEIFEVPYSANIQLLIRVSRLF